MSQEKLFAFIQEFCVAVESDCEERFQRFPKDLYQPELGEVVLGLLARQGSLTAELAKSPGIWNQHLAPLVHRAMADVLITLAFVLKENSQQRALDYILYGLGQEKLALAHLENHFKEQGKDPDEDEILAARRVWLNSQRYEHLTIVSVGSATGLSTREMASSSDNLAIYDFNFTPFSACVHSTCQHIARYNLRECENPLHGGHRIPTMPELPPGFHELWVACKTVRRTLELLDDYIGAKGSFKSWKLLNQVRDK